MSTSRRSGRNKARNFLAVTGNRHFFAALDQVEQVTEFVLGLESAEFMHVTSLQSSSSSIIESVYIL
jgi:hypothetical protein